ncbi:hypothetical protein AWENTII_000571 [Aspergillus wentii]
MEVTSDSVCKPSVKDALERARDHGPGPIHPDTKEILDNAMAEVKQKLERQPDSYVLTGDEFALFNYLRAEFKGPIWQKAVERFWNNYKGTNGSKT